MKLLALILIMTVKREQVDWLKKAYSKINFYQKLQNLVLFQ